MKRDFKTNQSNEQSKERNKMGVDGGKYNGGSATLVVYMSKL